MTRPTEYFNEMQVFVSEMRTYFKVVFGPNVLIDRVKFQAVTFALPHFGNVHKPDSSQMHGQRVVLTS